MKSLTKRQKIMLLVGIGIVLLAIFITTTLVINANQGGNSVSNPTPIPTPEPTSLTTQQEQAITEIQSALDSKTINSTALVQKLITEGKLEADQTDWRIYLQDTSLTTEAQIMERKKELQTILASLENKSPDDIPPYVPPTDPGRNPPPYQSPPNVRPTNEWEGILWDIRKFLGTNPSSDEIKSKGQEIKTQNKDPLEGINLAGADNATLWGLRRGDGEREIASKTGGLADAWKDFISLDAVGDGNCFLNSFAILLTGSQATDTTKETPGTQQNVATRLRVALCLEIMSNYDTADYSTKEDLKDYFIHNHQALTTDQCRHMARILKRPIVSVHKDPKDSNIIGSSWYDKFTFLSTLNFDYEEPFFIYHVGSFHFEPLVRPVEHQQGEIYFNFSRVIFEDENNSSGNRSIVFELMPGTLRKENFSDSQNGRLDLAGFLTKRKIRVSFSSNDEETNQYFAEQNSINCYKEATNINIFIRTLKAEEILIQGDEIVANSKFLKNINVIN